MMAADALLRGLGNDGNDIQRGCHLLSSVCLVLTSVLLVPVLSLVVRAQPISLILSMDASLDRTPRSSIPPNRYKHIGTNATINRDISIGNRVDDTTRS